MEENNATETVVENVVSGDSNVAANEVPTVEKTENKPNNNRGNNKNNNSNNKQNANNNNNNNANKGGGKNNKKKGLEIKTPKGTRDYDPVQMAIREKVFSKITNVYKRFGAVTIDTPIFELKWILTDKYGEDSKLIYDLQDQGGEICSLRYDLTVPFGRYLAMDRRIRNLKRYHIGRVYRRDQPSSATGRWREFYQCDFDIAGEYDPMLPDAEIILVAVTVLKEVEIGNFEFKVNHRKLLDGIFALTGVPPELFRPICSAVDKLDKTPWPEVKAEMVKKGLSEEIAEKIWDFVQMRGRPLQMLETLKEKLGGSTNDFIERALKDLTLLFQYVETFGVSDMVTFDLSLARGLDYYTGVIFEAVMLDKEGKGVGSIAGGGRYDELVGALGGTSIPCVGFSLGIERIFAIMEKKNQNRKVRASETEVLVCSMDDNLLRERLEICSLLWNAKIKTEHIHKVSNKIKPSLSYASDKGIPIVIILGQQEADKGVVKVKNMLSKEEKEIPRDRIVEEISAIVANLDN